MFSIKQKVEEKMFKDCYVVEVTGRFVASSGTAIMHMGGFHPKTDEVHLADLIETLERLVAAYQYGRGENDDYYHIPGYEKWFAHSSLLEKEIQQLPMTIQENAIEWLADPAGKPGSRATFASYQLYYFDENGTKYQVAYTPEQMRKVSSSMINQIGYDKGTSSLRVEFVNGSVYRYLNVPYSLYQDILVAESKGRFLNRNIKGQYEFEREN